MAPFRTVNTAFWQSSQVVDSFSATDRYTYLYLLTNSHTNLCGCYEISVRQIADETGLHRDEIWNSLYRLQVIHKVLDYHPETKEILLLNWLDQNWTTSPTWQKRVKKEISKRKCWGFVCALQRYAEHDWGALCEEDRALNDAAAEGAERVLAAYPSSLGKIWIITEWDRSATTILFPSEY